MKRQLILLIMFIVVLPSIIAGGDIWRLHFSDGNATLNGTDVCVNDGSNCLSDAGGSYDLNIDGDSGSGSITNAETLTVSGSEDISTTMSGNTLTIDYNGSAGGTDTFNTTEEMQTAVNSTDTFYNIDVDTLDGQDGAYYLDDTEWEKDKWD